MLLLQEVHAELPDKPLKLLLSHATQPEPLALISNPGLHTHESRNVAPVEDTRDAPTPQATHAEFAVLPLYAPLGQASQLDAGPLFGCGWKPATHWHAELNVAPVAEVVTAPRPQLAHAPLPALPL